MGGWVGLLMGIKEGTCCMELWVLYANKRSWNMTSKQNKNKTKNKKVYNMMIIYYPLGGSRSS